MSTSSPPPIAKGAEVLAYLNAAAVPTGECARSTRGLYEQLGAVPCGPITATASAACGPTQDDDMRTGSKWILWVVS